LYVVRAKVDEEKRMTFESHNPATGELVGTCAEHDEAETNVRLQRAWDGWQTVSGKKRAAHAASLAQRWGVHLVGVNVMLEQVPLPVSMSSRAATGRLERWQPTDTNSILRPRPPWLR
jgi:hypothetical protein